MDFDNMTRNELLSLLKYHGYAKLIKEVPGHPTFVPGYFYEIIQESSSDIGIVSSQDSHKRFYYDHNDVWYFTPNEINEYFQFDC
jgi:uncharacterized protein YneR